ncbi:cysteine proteinase [Westerdykella ornata]|uniref:ubiquitinyl hydrolase 1 n=1 Tax=Westerdykella ornata TaxID=318751 RepID=A0A6A6JMT8_WESOR|nr:cysteine proteinase [Westerdykella ornata]KAF2277911.1 cysteine proteinase [Westerdykella ornata]
MDPESAIFQPGDDFWRLQSEMLRVQQGQAELADRVSRLERRHDEDSRLKNVWGTSSPFPSLLGSTPQQVPLPQPAGDEFSNFDGQSSNLIGNLQLDAEDELPRRIGTTSRANSVRFDETADHGHWAHASRSSLDLIPRTGSGLGGHSMSERSYSHKSDGRQSSAGQSVHSATSGRANSLTGYGANSSADPPGIAPGLFILGPVPAIMRCWLSTNFKHDTLLYAAVCSGSYASCLDVRLLDHLGFRDRITEAEKGSRVIKLPVYLPEAISLSASSGSNSPAPQLPFINVEFRIAEVPQGDVERKGIQIFLGSDVLRQHNADILFSSNQLTLYDEDGNKLKIPLVRPENEGTFKSLITTSADWFSTPDKAPGEPETSAARQDSEEQAVDRSSATPEAKPDGGSAAAARKDEAAEGRIAGQRPLLGLSMRIDAAEGATESSPMSAAPHSGTSPAIWSNWRRDTEKASTQQDWGNAAKDSNTTYQRRDAGIKVLKPTRLVSRTVSSGPSTSPSPSTAHGTSRFFDDGKRRMSIGANKGKDKGQTPTLTRARSTNPVGGASAFSWMNSTAGTKRRAIDSRLSVSAGLHQAANLSLVRLSASAGCPCPLLLLLRSLPPASLPSASREARRSLVVTPFAPESVIATNLPALGAAPAPSVTTASTKKRKIAGSGPSPDVSQANSLAPHTLNDRSSTPLKSPRSSPLAPSAGLRSSPSPPRYIPRHMHDEVFEASAADDSASPSRDIANSAASSPTEAYAHLTLDSRESSNTMTADSDNSVPNSTQSTQPAPRPPPRSSSPAKRLHSDLDDAANDDADTQTARLSTSQSSPRATKPLPTASQRSARATSVEMVDAPTPSIPGNNLDTESSSHVPSLDEQVAKVLAIHQRPLSDGQEGFVVSEKWLARVFSRTTENRVRPGQFDKEATEGEIGPVDNSDLVDTSISSASLLTANGEPFVPLRPGLSLSHDFEVLPSDAWELIISWYGLKEGSPVIRRLVHNTTGDALAQNLQYELYPPIFTIRKAQKKEDGLDLSKPSPKLVASRSYPYVQFLKVAKTAAGIDMKTKVRVWRVLSSTRIDQSFTQPPGILTPDASPRPGSPVSATRNASVPLIVSMDDFLALADGAEREQVTGKDETANEKYNGHSSLHIVGLAEDQVLILEEEDEKGHYRTETSGKGAAKSDSQLSIKASGKVSKSTQSAANSGRNSPTTSGPMTRGRTRTGRTRGTVGLTNLGNTCYMNSALQCIRSVEELSLYFLMQKYKDDLNPDNPLGHGGSIARSYATLLESVYNVDGNSSFSPKAFKHALGRAQPLFSGYGQQDSQEFLSFLVDGLHEDLNRIKKKPYIEYPESDDQTVKDPAAIEALGQKFREIHHARNDSVAMDLFNGFYKNTMVCPECEKVSITFDPYSLLTLQLPIEQTWQHTITFVPRQGSMINVDVDIDKHASIKHLKEYIARRFEGVHWNRLMGAEVYSHKFFRILEDDKAISEYNFGVRDILYFYELDAAPTNWPPRKKKKQAYRSSFMNHGSSDEDIPQSPSPLSDRMVVPIFHRTPVRSNNYRAHHNWQMTLWPSFIMVTREEAMDYDAILKKVLAKVAQMTTRPILTEFTSGDQSPSSSDIVLTTAEDASPNADPRVQDGSVEGEENMVEVTMADANNTSPSEPSPDDMPEVLRPGTFIPPAFRALFEMKYGNPGGGIVPTGWGDDIHRRNYESLTSRVPVPASPQPSDASDANGNSNTSSGDELDDVPQFSNVAEQENQSSEDEIPSIEPPEHFARSGRQNSRKNRRKNMKFQKKQQQHAYSKKGKNRFKEQPSQSFSDVETDETAAIIRLGEAIILDWRHEGHEALFEGSMDEQDLRGVETTRVLETLKDPELDEKRNRRAMRRKNGITLKECFAETSKSEILSEDNAWYCNRCKERRRASKTLEIWTAPDILVVHLKRFSAVRNFRDKIEAFVDCPLEGLDLTGKVGLPEDKSLLYDLFAVDNHYGGLGGGHYTACARNFFDGKWYDYNDSIVSPKNPNNVVTSAAYLLFYRRRSDRPLGPPYLQKIVEQFRNPDSDDSVDGESDGADDQRNPSASLAGNGSRLGDSSRNGSSSALGAGAGALRAAGSTSAGNLLLNGAGVGTVDADEEMLEGQELPPPYDEGYAGGDDDDDDNNFQGVSVDGGGYGPLVGGYYPGAQWDFSNVPAENQSNDADDDDDRSDMVNLGEDDGDCRMLEDFGDELDMDGGLAPGMSTPLEEQVPPPYLDDGDDEGEVANVVLGPEEDATGVSVGRSENGKLD